MWSLGQNGHNATDGDLFWERGAAAYEAQPETVVQRSLDSLRSRWGALQRAVEKYLADDNLYPAAIPSGEVEAETWKNGMSLHSSNNLVTTKDGRRNPPILRSVPAAVLLSGCPTFSGKIGALSAPRSSRQAGAPSRGQVPNPPAVLSGSVEESRQAQVTEGGPSALISSVKPCVNPSTRSIKQSLAAAVQAKPERGVATKA